jgi:hypothetical protein
VARKKPATVQISDGVWYALGNYDRQICCGCGLHHRLEYKLEKGRIFERVTVDEKATEAERKKHGIKVIRAPA